MMNGEKHFIREKLIAAVCLFSVSLSGCQQVGNLSAPTVTPTSLRDVPALRLSYRFEADVPVPPNLEEPRADEKLPAVQADFDQNRPTETVQRIVLAPDKQRALVIYQRGGDKPLEYRLDLYEAGGKLVRKITTETIALVYPEIAAWSPDAGNFAFSGVRREGGEIPNDIVQDAPTPPDLETANNSGDDANVTASPGVSPSPNAAVAAFEFEQIYTANRDGGDLRRASANQNLMYFYFVWSPDGQALAALACREIERRQAEFDSKIRGELPRPKGRPRVIEKNGKERLLDDNLTDVFPVWSPDSSKAATAFGTIVRVYDALGNSPTSAAIGLQAALQTASRNFEQRMSAAANAPQQPQPAAPNAQSGNAVSLWFNPIVALRWTDDKSLFLQTAFARDYPNETVRKYARWHRLDFSPQAASLG